MRTNLKVHFSGLVFLDNCIEKKKEATLWMVRARQGSPEHLPRILIPADAVDWKRTKGDADLVLCLPDGSNAAVWNLAPGDRVDFPGNSGGLGADLTVPSETKFPSGPASQRSMWWIASLQHLLGKKAKLVAKNREGAHVRLTGGTIQPGRFSLDPKGDYYLYGFSSSGTTSSIQPMALAITITWLSNDLLPSDTVKIVPKSGSTRDITLAVGRVPEIGIGVSNEPGRPCGKKGRLTDWIAMYDQMKHNYPDKDLVLPEYSPPPSLGSGFCPPGGYP